MHVFPEQSAETAPSALAPNSLSPSASGFSGSPFSVRLEFFSGPMDLLLHLVHQQEVPIEEVEMAVIAEQYLQIISKASYLDLDQATEYLVIAATLMAIKSESLLPVHSSGPVEDEELYDKRFFAELRERLMAYELTKKRAETLVKLPQLGVDTFTRIDKKALLPTPEMYLEESEDPQSLSTFFYKLLKRVGSAVNSMRIRLEPISVVSFMMKIIDNVQGELAVGDVHQKKSFATLIRGFLSAGARGQSETVTSKAEARGVVIGSFMAVLELVKRGLISVAQEGDCSSIEISPKIIPGGAAELELSSEFDEPTKAEGDNSVLKMADYRENPPVDNTDEAELMEVNRGK